MQKTIYKNIEDVKPKVSNKKNYLKLLVIIAIVSSIIIAISLVVLWQFLLQFEKSTPRYALDNYFINLQEKNYDAIKNNSNFTPDEFNTWEDYFEYLQNNLGYNNSELLYRQTVSEKENNAKSYIVYHNDEKIGIINLKLNENNTYDAYVNANYEYNYKIITPKFIDVFVNGVKLSNQNTTIETTAIKEFQELNENAPSIITYTLPPMLFVPEITGKTPNGDVQKIEFNEDENIININAIIDDKTKKIYEEKLISTAKDLATFITGDNDYWGIEKHLYPNAKIINSINDYSSYWYIDHQSFDFSNIIVEDLIKTSETTFTGVISFDYHIIKDLRGKNHTFPSKYRMDFAKNNDEWYLIDLLIQ